MSVTYSLIRTDADSLRLDRHDGADRRPIAVIELKRDAAGEPLGWRLKPLVMMRGSKSRLWPSPEDAIASTALLSLREAKVAVAQANRGGSWS
jgi:hypothetical protein